MKLLLSTIILLQSFALWAGSCSDTWKNIHEIYGDLGMYKTLDGKCDREFKDALRELISTNIDLGYRGARHEMFSYLDNVNGIVCGVYTDECIKTKDIPNANVMNCEHSWPQSHGAVGIAKSDLHHLYPVISSVNSRRSNYDFCEVKEVRWEKSGSRYGDDDDGERCFEPRDEHKGDVARSMLYFAVRYKKSLDSKQEDFLRSWSYKFEVSDKELERNDNIEELQHNRNPFVDIPEFVELIADF
jgi:endonuclease I